MNADADMKTDAAVMKLSRMAAQSFRLGDTSAIMRQGGRAKKYRAVNQSSTRRTDKLLSPASLFH